MATSRVPFFALFFLALTASISASDDAAASDSKEFVLTLDHTNFHETIAKHDFIVVEFYAPWCGHCKSLAPEYEKAASILSSHDPPIVLAKVDANEDLNKDLATEYDVKGFPTLKILRSGGKSAQEYNGPREAEGIVEYLKKQSGPASVEIKSAEDAAALVGEQKVVIVGIFPEFSGEEYTSFTALAEKLRSEYEFGHTSDAKLLPRGEKVAKPTLRLFKPFDELVVDFQDFQVDAMEKFIEESSIPTVTVFSKDPANHPYVIKFFYSPNAKAIPVYYVPTSGPGMNPMPRGNHHPAHMQSIPVQVPGPYVHQYGAVHGPSQVQVPIGYSGSGPMYGGGAGLYEMPMHANMIQGQGQGPAGQPIYYGVKNSGPGMVAAYQGMVGPEEVSESGSDPRVGPSRDRL